MDITRLFRVGMMGALLAALSSGCALPRIDPQGRSIFLPQPNYTRLQAPFAPELSRLSCLPRPAWTKPADPDPCPETATSPLGPPTAACGKGKVKQRVRDHLAETFHPERAGALKLDPLKRVATVGSEVVFRAGVCGKDGYFVTNQPLEWILTADSVGHLVAIGNSGRPVISSLLGKTPRKFTSNFAVTHTACKGHILTRGTVTPRDDVTIRKGEGWVSVTSPNEGVSYVSAIAPKTVGWEERRETATIHWVDAKWEFPPVETVRAGREHELVTTVQFSDGSPKPGWTVRYKIDDGPPAELGEGGQVAEVTTDEMGHAPISVRPLTNEPGETKVLVDVIRPGDKFLSRQVVGRGRTRIRWSAAGLRIRAAGPEVAEFEQVVTYRVEVSNPGDLTARDVVVTTLRLPAALEHLRSNPASEAFADRQQWRLGDLEPGQTRTLEADYRVVQPVDSVQFCVEGRSAGEDLRAEDCVRTNIFQPSLDVRISGPEEAEVGAAVKYGVTVQNTGRGPLTNVSVEDAFDPGLRHSEGRSSPIFQDLGDLKAGETRQFAVTFVTTRPGRFCHTLTAKADGGQSDSAQACVTVRERPVVERPDLRITLTGPSQAEVGRNDTDEVDDDDVLFRAVIENAGNTVLTNVRVDVETDVDILDAKRATQQPYAFKRSARGFYWEIPSLPIGAQEEFKVVYNPRRESAATLVQATAAAEGGVRETDQRTIRVLPAAGQRPPGAAPGAVLPDVTGGLKVEVVDTKDSIPVGETTQFLIYLTNNRNELDNNARVTISIPDGLELKTIKSGPTRSLRTDGRIVEFEPIRAMRSKEEFRPYIIEVIGRRPGTYNLEVEVRSRLSPEGIKKTESTRVY